MKHELQPNQEALGLLRNRITAGVVEIDEDTMISLLQGNAPLREEFVTEIERGSFVLKCGEFLLLAMYPENGIRETVNEYTTTEGVKAIFESFLAGIVLSQLMYNSINFDTKNSIVILLILVSLGLLSNLVSYSELFVVTISLCFVGFLPSLENRITSKIGSGKGRANALAISTLIGIILIFAITYASLSSVNRIGDGNGAIAVALWLTVAVTAIGLIGMLLPLFGFDEHPRPEAWGWRFGLSVSAILISLQTDLSGHILLGIALAILISVSSPLVLEKGQQKAAQ